jgi:long-chain acyl-CoA synthetase
MNMAIYFGWTVVLVPKPQPPQLLEAIEKDTRSPLPPWCPPCTSASCSIPDIEKVDLSSIDNMFSGSAPLPVEVIKEFEKRTGGIIVEGFGLTETSPMTHINPCGEGSLRKVGSIGCRSATRCAASWTSTTA